MKFANDACTSSTTAYNGTCLTTSECTVKFSMLASFFLEIHTKLQNVGGTASGSCAEGKSLFRPLKPSL